MPSKSNKLLRLVEQFQALPKQKELKQAKILLTTIAAQTEAQAESLNQQFGRLVALRGIQEQPELMEAEVQQTLKTLRALSQTLDQQVRTGGTTPKVTGPLDSLTKTTGSISKSIDVAWAAADNDILQTTNALIELTAKYDPAAERTLRLALNRFKALSGPSGADAVADYKEAREALVEARMNLDIPGVVGHFLSDAAKGVGSASGLTHPEVQAFLNSHPSLWPRLTVRLT